MSPFCYAEIQHHAKWYPEVCPHHLDTGQVLKAQSALLLKHSSYGSFNYLSVVMLHYWKGKGRWLFLSLLSLSFLLLQHLYDKVFGHILFFFFNNKSFPELRKLMRNIFPNIFSCSVSMESSWFCDKCSRVYLGVHTLDTLEVRSLNIRWSFGSQLSVL